MIVKKTIPEMFAASVEKHSNNNALCRKVSGVWKPVTYAELGEKASIASKGLYSLGLRSKDRIAFMIGNSPEWTFTDLGAQSIGAANVSLYGTLAPDQAAHILKDSGSRMALVSGEEQVEKLKKIIDELPALETVITMEEGVGPFGSKNVVTFADMMAKGAEAGDSIEREVTDARNKVGEDDLASIIYTSGTTGLPKGVMLTNKNFMSNLDGLSKVLDIFDSDSHLSFLPLSHVFERTCGYYVFLASGGTINYAESMEKIADNIKEVHPTVVISVPRLFEKMIAKIKEKVSYAPAARQKLFYWALDVGERSTNKNNPDRNSIALKIQYAIAKALVYKKLHQAFGGKIRFFVSGGAALSVEVSNFFRSVGINVVEGYGLTETSPIITVNPVDDIRGGTVGKVLPNVEVKFEGDGELLVRGPSISKGYFNNEEATKESFDNDGWFHTGDIAELDGDGYLRITDRKKDLIVMSNGKNVAPLTLESKLVGDEFIAQAVVIGNNRNYITAVIVADFDRLKRAADELGITRIPDSNRELVEHDLTKAFYQERIDQIMKDFARFEQIKKFVLLPEEFSEAGGELTPTLKIKRKIVSKKYEGLIEGMYK
jgi:long-chain acyl-CoA synthetase